MGESESGGWLLVTVSTAGAPASLRVIVWRKLKELGALYLQQSVALLPRRATTQNAVAQLVARIDQDGGTARVLIISLADEAQEQDVIAELQEARTGEYAEILERFPSFFAELEQETARGRTTFEEVEESEVDLARFRTWLRKTAARDYFQAPLGQKAREELRRAEEAMARFAELAMNAHNTTLAGGADEPGESGEESAQPPRLRRLPD
ncbi:MAG: hypothetical protein KGR99_10455 [Betaproteobacteria bacterium]|nr:hypothetical protein [Betaproteobacteria bacterium]